MARRGAAPRGAREAGSKDPVCGAEPAREDYEPWYKTALWRKIRRMQLAEHPLCWFHLQRERPEVVRATVVHHVEPHRGDWEKFVGGPFMSLCKGCHDQHTRAETDGREGYDRQAIDPKTGLPLDTRHPWLASSGLPERGEGSGAEGQGRGAAKSRRSAGSGASWQSRAQIKPRNGGR